MKDKIKQIEFIDQKLLLLYNIKSVQDYNSKVSLNSIKKIKNIIEDLNKLLPKIKELFPVKEFNLHKTGNKITSHTQAFAILKTCLDLANIPYEVIRCNKVASVRLIEKNNSLENYINKYKMSDVRVRDSFIMKSDYDQNQDQEVTIDCTELESAAKSEVQIEYFIPLSLTSISHDKKSIGIDLTRILKDLNNVTIDIMGNNILLTDEFINKAFYGSKYEINIGGSIYYTSILERNKNIFPNDTIPLPFSKNLFSQVYLVIFCDLALGYDILKNDTDIRVISNEVTFTQKMLDRLGNKNYKIELKNQDTSKLVFSGGMVHVIKELKELNNSNNLEKHSLNTMQELQKLGGTEFTSSNYKCYRMKKCTFIEKISPLIPLVCGYDICCQELSNVPLNLKYYMKNDNVYRIEHTFLRTHDAISNISIHFPKPIKVTKLQIQIDEIVNFWQWPVRNFEPEFINVNNGLEVKINLQKNHYLPMVNAGVILVIEFEDQYDSIHYILYNTTLSYDNLVAECEIRRNILSSTDDFILE